MKKEKVFLILALIVAIGMIGYFVWAWTPPSVAPPGGNVPAPVNVGDTAQTKTGSFESLAQITAGTSFFVGGTELRSTFLKLYKATEAPPEDVGYGQLYTDASRIYFKDESGNETDLTAVGGLTTCRPSGFDYDTICSIPVKVGDTPCPIWKDCDGDGYTYGNGDCDENCDTCYVGSTATTGAPDGRDQDCDGKIDETSEPYTVIVNSYSNKTCEEACNGINQVCVSIGLDSDGTDCNYWTWWLGGGCQIRCGGCDTKMTREMSGKCSGYSPRWTRCKCCVRQ